MNWFIKKNKKDDKCLEKEISFLDKLKVNEEKFYNKYLNNVLFNKELYGHSGSIRIGSGTVPIANNTTGPITINYHSLESVSQIQSGVALQLQNIQEQQNMYNQLQQQNMYNQLQQQSQAIMQQHMLYGHPRIEYIFNPDGSFRAIIQED